MKKLVSILFIQFVIGLGSFAQPLTRDHSFQPFFDIRNNSMQIGPILGLYEFSNTGNIFIFGGFKFPVGGQAHDGITLMRRNGNRVPTFTGLIGSSKYFVGTLGDSIFIVNDGILYKTIDTTGQYKWINNSAWNTNYRKTARCTEAIAPYFFEDGTSLMSKGLGIPGSCTINNPPDTFPHRYIVKVTPQGLWDSSFVPDANYHATQFIEYDSNRLFVIGQSKYLTNYDGNLGVNGLFRIYKDGRYDSSFIPPLSDTNALNSFSIHGIAKDGSFFICGNFLLKDSTTYNTLVKLNSDGSLDPTFMNEKGPTDTNPSGIQGVSTICSTPDGGYLVGGLFNRYQGYVKNNIAKINSNGLVEPQYFTSEGPDSSYQVGDTMGNVSFIKKSKFGGYYVMGDFFTWDGLPVQGIVRITDLTTSLSNFEKPDVAKISIYPNPTNGNVNISSNIAIENIVVYNKVGQLIQRYSGTVKNIKLPPQKGLYIIQSITKNGLILSQKVMQF